MNDRFAPSFCPGSGFRSKSGQDRFGNQVWPPNIFRRPSSAPNLAADRFHNKMWPGTDFGVKSSHGDILRSSGRGRISTLNLSGQGTPSAANQATDRFRSKSGHVPISTSNLAAELCLHQILPPTDFHFKSRDLYLQQMWPRPDFRTISVWADFLTKSALRF